MANLEVRPIAGALGAEIHGVRLDKALDADVVAAIRQALLDHLVIFFREQDLPPERFLAAARRFGEPVEYPFVHGIEGYPHIIQVEKLEHETVNFGGIWHSDTTYLPRRWASSWSRARCRRSGATRCLPTNIWPTTRCRRA